MVSWDPEKHTTQAGGTDPNVTGHRAWLAAELRALGAHPTPESLQRLLTHARDRVLDEEAVPELADLRGRLAAAVMVDAVRRGRLPVVPGLHPLPPGDRCHFVAPARFGRRRSDQCGHLALTGGWLRFHGALDLSVTWGEVARIERTGHEISFALRDSSRLLRFHCPTVEDAASAEVLARHLAAAAREVDAAHGRAGVAQPVP